MLTSRMPHLTQTLAPSTEPLSLAETKLYLKIDEQDEDITLLQMIRAARLAAEKFMRRSLITQRWKMGFDDFAPARVQLMRGPVQSIMAVTLTTRDGTSQALSGSAYTLSAGNAALRFDISPVAHMVEVEYVAGYGDASQVPYDIQQGLLAHVAYMFEHRGQTNLPPDTLMQYDPYRVIYL